MNKKLFSFVLISMFLLAAGMASAAISPQLSTLLIKPEANFSIGDIAYISMHVVSLGGTPTPFTVNITLTGGVTNLTSVYISNTTGSCDVFRCVHDTTQGFRITGLGDFQPIATITDNLTNTTTIIPGSNGTSGVDNDGDGYFSTGSGGNDCGDNSPNIYPGAPETCGDGIDQDCNGADTACPSSGGGNSGGGGGGGGSSSKSSGALASTGYNCLKGNVSIGKNDKIIVPYAGTNYTFFVSDILASTVQAKLYPIPSRDYSLDEGKSKEIDLDRNNRNDFTIKIEDIKLGKAIVTCKTTSEIGGEVKKEEKKEESVIEKVTEVARNIREGILNIASEVVPKKGASPVIGSLIALAIVVAGLLIYYITRKGDDEREF